MAQRASDGHERQPSQDPWEVYPDKGLARVNVADFSQLASISYLIVGIGQLVSTNVRITVVSVCRHQRCSATK